MDLDPEQFAGREFLLVPDHVGKRWAKDRNRRGEDETGAVARAECTRRVE